MEVENNNFHLQIIFFTFLQVVLEIVVVKNMLENKIPI